MIALSVLSDLREDSLRRKTIPTNTTEYYRVKDWVSLKAVSGFQSSVSLLSYLQMHHLMIQGLDRMIGRL